MNVAFACAVSALAVYTVATDKVSVEIMVESFCPCSGAWEAGFAANFLPKVGDIVELTRFFDGKANGTQHCCNPSAGPIATCEHREAECIANSLQRCVQEHYPLYTQWLEFTNCVNGPCLDRPDEIGCKYQFSVGRSKSLLREQACARNLGMDWDAVNTCWTGDEGIALAQKDADKSDAIEERYGILMKGEPVVWVDGKRVSTKWDCGISGTKYQRVLLKAICDAFEGKPIPAACAQIAQVV